MIGGGEREAGRGRDRERMREVKRGREERGVQNRNIH